MADRMKGGAGTVSLSGRLVCRSEREAEIVHRHLPEHVRLTRAEPGCISFDVLPTDDPLIWTVEEHFRDQESFRSHQTRTQASAWGAATADTPRDYEITGLE